MTLTGGCHCGAIRYEVSGDPVARALCHCSDCRRHAGAPVVGWAMFHAAALKTMRGEPKVYNSSVDGRRHFCANCGTGVFYFNERNLPGIVDVQIATLDDPDRLPPQVQVQVAERIGWMTTAHELPAFERYPTRP